ncbi:MAG: asparagine--tRNA ligase, partial [Bacteroidetes bacterium HGW-Bacteroidetes-15]
MAQRIKIKDLFEKQPIGEEVTVMGWVRTKRGSKNVAFIALNDGSTIKNVQIVVELNANNESFVDKATTGAAIAVNGKVVASQGSGQAIEINCTTLEILGEANPEEYPLQPKKHSLEFLREIEHLRYRTNTFSAVGRIRHAMTFAIHKFFN